MLNSSHKRQLCELIKKAKEDKRILAVFLFGSAARGDASENSDIDVCLVLNNGSYAPLELSRKKIEYLKLFSADVQIFQQLPIYIRMRVIKEGKVLFCADEDSLYGAAFSAINEFSDFEHIYRDYLREVSNVR